MTRALLALAHGDWRAALALQSRPASSSRTIPRDRRPTSRRTGDRGWSRVRGPRRRCVEQGLRTRSAFSALLGTFGVDRFYRRAHRSRHREAPHVGGCGIWALVDTIMYLVGDLPKDGRRVIMDRRRCNWSRPRCGLSIRYGTPSRGPLAERRRSRCCSVCGPQSSRQRPRPGRRPGMSRRFSQRASSISRSTSASTSAARARARIRNFSVDKPGAGGAVPYWGVKDIEQTMQHVTSHGAAAVVGSHVRMSAAASRWQPSQFIGDVIGLIEIRTSR